MGLSKAILVFPMDGGFTGEGAENAEEKTESLRRKLGDSPQRTLRAQRRKQRAYVES